jgi:hypothetical protein
VNAQLRLNFVLSLPLSPSPEGACLKFPLVLEGEPPLVDKFAQLNAQE